MYAVIDKRTDRILTTCQTREAAMIAAQLEKDKVGIPERRNITAVILDDEGYSDILF